jgi:hypothetical protein
MIECKMLSKEVQTSKHRILAWFWSSRINARHVRWKPVPRHETHRWSDVKGQRRMPVWM